MVSWRGELCNQHGQTLPHSSSPGCVEKMVHDRHAILPDWVLECQDDMGREYLEVIQLM
jgi:hypothetical protein